MHNRKLTKLLYELLAIHDEGARLDGTVSFEQDFLQIFEFFDVGVGPSEHELIEVRVLDVIKLFVFVLKDIEQVEVFPPGNAQLVLWFLLRS